MIAELREDEMVARCYRSEEIAELLPSSMPQGIALQMISRPVLERAPR
jgi:hypothetical protein